MHGLRFRWLTGAILAAATLAPSAAPAQSVGRVQVASGEVQIIGRDKETRPAVRGTEVSEGDTIVTGKSGAAHIRMIDQGIIAMRPDTTIVIDTYRYAGKEDGSERGVLSLLKGGFRAITGVIGRTNKSQYLVNTPTATIGIRGTDHEPFHIAPPAPGETPPAPPGTYNKVNLGDTFIRTQGGILELSANQVGFASVQPNLAPVKLERVPDFMRATALPRGRADLRGVRESAARDPRRGEFVRARHDRDLSPHQLRQLAARLIRTAGEDFDLASQKGAFRQAPNGTALVASIFSVDNGNLIFGTGGIVVSGNNDNFILLNAANDPVIVTNRSDFMYARDQAPLLDTGAAIVDGGGVKWGVYAGGLRFDERGVSRVLLLTFAEAARITTGAELAAPGMQVFGTTVGFTLPIDESSRIGGGTARLDATVVFGANPRITAYDLRVIDGSARAWRGLLTGPQSLQSFAGGQPTPNLSVTCAGACASTGFGNASGFVIGENRGGLISSYGMKAGAAIVTGSIVVRP